MGIEKLPRLANQFWPNFIKKKIISVIVVQVIISIVISATLLITDTLSIDSILLWAITAAILIINITVNLLILVSSTRPTRELMAAVLSVSGQMTSLVPPNPNTAKYEQTGFRDALQTIYELSISNGDEKPDADSQKATKEIPILKDALSLTKSGFIALDNKRTIIYANKSAPIHTDNNGIKSIELLFNGNDNLESWLNDCKENSVHADKIWTRVPDRLPNEENRRFFDVIASYQKESVVETVLTLIDRTSSYVVDEEDLDFISFAAHELRGPTTVIRGYLDVLENELSDALKDDQQELFHRLTVSSTRLSSYIDNILNTARYDRRHLKMNLSEETISVIYDAISDDMKLRASSQNRLLNVSFPADLPTIAADRASIGEVIGNLIDNAIKYSNEGGLVNVTAKVSGDFVELSVQDNGIGMPESVVSNLFQKFYRSHRSRETIAGTGIGLYISKAIVESHGGNISVRSEDGKGSIFTVSLPIYSTVADKLKAGDNSNKGLISEGNGWIKNHSMYRS